MAQWTLAILDRDIEGSRNSLRTQEFSKFEISAVAIVPTRGDKRHFIRSLHNVLDCTCLTEAQFGASMTSGRVPKSVRIDLRSIPHIFASPSMLQSPSA